MNVLYDAVLIAGMVCLVAVVVFGWIAVAWWNSFDEEDEE